MNHYGIISLQNKYFDRPLSRIQPYKLNGLNSFVIVPFDIYYGFAVNDDRGVSTPEIDRIQDFSTFQRIFTGRETILAEWSNSVVIKNDNIQTDNEYVFSREFKVGDYFTAFTFSANASGNYQPSPIDSDFVMNNIVEEIEVRTYYRLKKEDLFKLYIIPQFIDTKQPDAEWYYISNAITWKKPNGDFFATDITFRTLNTALATTGQAINELVLRSAPSDYYAWPKIIKSHFKDKEDIVLIDENYMNPLPTTEIQISVQAGAAISDLSAWGRPITTTYDARKNVKAPRRLLPILINTPQPSPINTRPVPSSDYYFLNYATPQMETSFATWNKARQAQYNPALQNAFEGITNCNQKLSDIEKTNDTNNNYTPYLIWNNDWVHKIGGYTRTGNKENPITPNTNSFEYSTAGSPYAGRYENNVFSNLVNITPPTFQQIKNDISSKNVLTTAQVLCHNIFANDKRPVLSPEIRYNTVWNIKDLPFFLGQVASRIVGGINFGWINSKITTPSEPLMLFTPKSLLEYGESIMNAENSTEAPSARIPFEIFNKQTKFASDEFGGLTALSCIFKVELTDRFGILYDGNNTAYKDGKHYYVFSTNDLSQNYSDIKNVDIYRFDLDIPHWEKRWVFADNVDISTINKRCFWTDTSIPIPKKATTKGYTIDSLHAHFLGKTTMRWSCFNNNVSIFSQTQKTYSDFANNIRMWEQILLTSNIKPTGDKLAYPKDYITPKAPDTSQLLDIKNFRGNVLPNVKDLNDKMIDGRSFRDPVDINTLNIKSIFEETFDKYYMSVAGHPHFWFRDWNFDGLNVKIKDPNAYFWFAGQPERVETAIMPPNWTTDYKEILVNIKDINGTDYSKNFTPQEIINGVEWFHNLHPLDLLIRPYSCQYPTPGPEPRPGYNWGFVNSGENIKFNFTAQPQVRYSFSYDGTTNTLTFKQAISIQYIKWWYIDPKSTSQEQFINWTGLSQTWLDGIEVLWYQNAFLLWDNQLKFKCNYDVKKVLVIPYIT